MSVRSEIAEALRAYIIMCATGVKGATNIFTAEVLSVEDATRSCTVLSISGEEETEYTGVLLMADVNDGQYIVPAIGSTVLVGNNKNQQPFVVMFSEIQSIVWITGGSKITVKDGLIQFNDGSYGGMVEVANLTTKLNNLEKLVNDFITKYNTHTHTGVQTGGGTSAVTTAPETGSLTPTQQSDIENTKVTHGK